MSDRLSDEQVAWWVDRPEPNGVTIHEAQRTCTALAREVQELRAEVERLTAENARIQRIAHAAGVIDLLNAERTLADQLAEALVYQRDMIGSGMDKAMLRNVRLSLEAWKAARHE